MPSNSNRSKFPVPHALPSYWRKQVGPIDRHRSTPRLPSSADIVVVGAGYVGASLAYHLVEESARCGRKVPEIVVLEAREACSGATGRNGMFHLYLISLIPIFIFVEGVWWVGWY